MLMGSICLVTRTSMLFQAMSRDCRTLAWYVLRNKPNHEESKYIGLMATTSTAEERRAHVVQTCEEGSAKVEAETFVTSHRH